MIFDKTLSDIVKKVSNIHDLTEEEGKRMVEFMFLQIKNAIQDPDLPKILLKGFGTFNVRALKLKDELDKLEAAKEILKPEIYESKKEFLTKAFERKQKEEGAFRRREQYFKDREAQR